MKWLSRVRLFATPWIVAYQASPSMGFSRQEYWSGLPFPSPGDLPDPRIKPGSPALQAASLPTEPPSEAKWKSLSCVSDSLQPHGLYGPWNSLGQNTGVGSLFLLQGIFPTQGSNPALPHCRWTLYQLSHKGSPLSHQGYPNFKNWNNNPNAYWASIMCSELCIDCFIYMHWHLVDVSSGWTKSKDLCPYGVYFLLWDTGIKQIITRIHI